MNRLTIARYELADGREVRVERALPEDARRFLGFNAVYAEPHRHHLFESSDDAIEALETKLEAQQALDGPTLEGDQLEIPRYVIGSVVHDEGETVVSTAKINARYPGDHAVFESKGWERTKRPNLIRRKLLNAPTLPLRGEYGRTQQELFELSTNSEAGIEGLAAMTVLPLVGQLPEATEVYATLDAANEADIATWTEEFGAEQVGGPVIHKKTGRHLLLVMRQAGMLTYRLQGRVFAQGHTWLE